MAIKAMSVHLEKRELKAVKVKRVQWEVKARKDYVGSRAHQVPQVKKVPPEKSEDVVLKVRMAL